MTTKNSTQTVQAFPTTSIRTQNRTLSAIVAQQENGQVFFGAASLAAHACAYFNELNVNALDGYVRVTGRKYHSAKVYEEVLLNGDELVRLGAICISSPAKAACLVNLVVGISTNFGVKAFSNKYPVVDMEQAHTMKVAGKDVRVCTTANGSPFVNFNDLVAAAGAERAELAERVLKAIPLHQIALFLDANNTPVAFLPLEAVISLFKANEMSAEVVADLTKATRKAQADYADAQVLAPQALNFPGLLAQVEHTTFHPQTIDYTEVEAKLQVAPVEVEVTADAAEAEVKAQAAVTETVEVAKVELPVAESKTIYVDLEQLSVDPDAEDTKAEIQAVQNEVKFNSSPETDLLANLPSGCSLVVSRPASCVGFNFEGHEVRTQVGADGEALFCLADVCKAMGLTNSRMITAQIKDEFKGCKLNLLPFETAGGRQVLTFITEPQLYFVMMRGRSSIAHKFRQWVCNEVIPAIRKHGHYGHCQMPAVPAEGTLSYVKFADALVGTLKDVGIDIRDQLDFIINRARKQGMAIIAQDHDFVPNKVTAAFLATLPGKLTYSLKGQMDGLKSSVDEIKATVDDVKSLVFAALYSDDLMGVIQGRNEGDNSEQVQYLKELTNAKVDENILASISESNKRIANGELDHDETLTESRQKRQHVLETSSRCIALLEQAIESSYMPEYRKSAYRQLIEEANRALIILCA